MKNLQGKTVKRENAYEVWQTSDGSWTWSSNVEDIAEQLRKDNAQLRELGQFWYEKTKEVAEDLENLKDWIRIHGYE